MAWFNVPFISPFAWGSATTETGNTNPTKRFSVSRQSSRVTADSSGRTYTSSPLNNRFTADDSGRIFTDTGNDRFSGD